jgi:hypothetical protein
MSNKYIIKVCVGWSALEFAKQSVNQQYRKYYQNGNIRAAIEYIFFTVEISVFTILQIPCFKYQMQDKNRNFNNFQYNKNSPKISLDICLLIGYNSGDSGGTVPLQETAF